ncbi:alpha/beta-hydrolase [Clavulina sp. PMI_390]|nr:alpha/beta-hydrolase [Clavulina sp. PMI_390]
MRNLSKSFFFGITACLVALGAARPFLSAADSEGVEAEGFWPHLPWDHDHPYNASIRPLVLWHGMGDSAFSASMLEFAELCRSTHLGLFVHIIHIEDNLDKDQQAGFFGNLWDQLEVVHEQLSNITELRNGFDALGFSQGGQFLRAYAEAYNDPPIKNLITFGSQHMGVSDLPTCRPGDVFCQLARVAARRGVYTSYAQSHLVQAQYFRDPNQYERFLRYNNFLAVINGEVDDPETSRARNVTFKDNLEQLEELVLVMWDKDTTVVPRESSWFGSVAIPSEDERSRWGIGWGDPVEIVPMRMQPLYTNNWIGLKTLDEAGKVTLLSCAGEHMQVTRECWEPIVGKYAGSVVDVDSSKTLSNYQSQSQPKLVIQS